ncbi:sporulation integral membrane protein YlbJ [Paenibacillus allorhizosphaerae]|uniref:Sporulation integral membrane protein YlbJ n=1 Tax=Paenibacillus allorhizosphaerae TaxID=2849866 RepID=A0ABM8VM47_9BACL|nr:sporulation integral membrane protein YlbJ [Paenibacillus allorhizosphaerae]CAG7649387.1 Sporulation integral membrane protein YlbJ [Paenibacillus allorhizosphaerae]
MRRSNFMLYGAALIIFSLALLMLAFPAEALQASLKGISIWWDVLFPSLFPFFVISEMMLGVGLVHFFGTLLDPLMRPLFRIPGIGGFVMAMGFASGYPIGARLTSQLWEKGLVNREEGERLVSFTTSSDPIFLIGAVSVGFFHNPAIAGLLAAAHYGSAMLVGLLMRFHGKPVVGNNVQKPAEGVSSGPIWRRAFEEMHAARLADGRPLGVMLQKALGSAVQLVMLLGGLVVFFSVVMEVLSSAGIMAYVYAGVDSVLSLFGVPVVLSKAVVNGFFEVTLGTKAAGNAESIPLVYKAAIAAWVLSWAGLSVHAQIVSLLHHTNLRYLPFAFARFIHGLLAVVFVIVLWKPLDAYQEALGAFMPQPDVTRPLTTMIVHALPTAAVTFAALIGTMLMMSLLFWIGKRCMNRLRT